MPAVPAAQAAVVATYALLVLYLERVPEVVFLGLFVGSPVVFGSAWALGWLVRRRRGANRPDGGEYMIATLGNVLMGFAFVLSVLMWVLILWSSRGMMGD